MCTSDVASYEAIASRSGTLVVEDDRGEVNVAPLQMCMLCAMAAHVRSCRMARGPGSRRFPGGDRAAFLVGDGDLGVDGQVASARWVARAAVARRPLTDSQAADLLCWSRQSLMSFLSRELHGELLFPGVARAVGYLQQWVALIPDEGRRTVVDYDIVRVGFRSLPWR